MLTFLAPSLATSRLHNGYGRLIADTFGGALRNTVTTFANRTEREFRDVTFGLFGSTRQTDFIGDRAGAEYQGDLSLGSFGLFTFGARADVLIYLGHEVQELALHSVRRAVRHEGYLCLGEAEWLAPAIAATLAPLAHDTRIFRAN